MAKHSRTLGERLIRIILKHRGNATMRQIAWGGLRAEDLEEAKRQTKNLVMFEATYRNGKQQASQTARLTDRGVWEAIRMSEVYDTALVAAALAAPGIEAYLTRLEKEKHPLAVKIAGYRKDAELWQNRQKRDVELERDQRETVKRVQALLNKLVDKIPSKICKRDIRTLNAFLEKKGRPRIEPKYVMPGETPQQAPEHRVQATPATPAQPPPADEFARDFAKMQRDLSMIQEPARGFSNLPRPADVAENARIIELFKKTPCSGELLPNGRIRYDNQDMTPKRWEIERFKQSA